LAAPVKAALGADSVEKDGVPAVSAFDERGCSKLHVYGAAAACSRFGRPKFRYSHDITSFALSFGQSTGDNIQKF